MFERILKQFRKKILTYQYVMTIHAEEEKDNDNLTIYDIEHCILTGEIVERQKGRITGEWKYRVRGKTLAGNKAGKVAKISLTRNLVIITVFSE